MTCQPAVAAVQDRRHPADSSAGGSIAFEVDDLADAEPRSETIPCRSTRSARIDSGPEVIYLRNVKDDKKCMGVDGAQVIPGANIGLYDCHPGPGVSNQNGQSLDFVLRM